MNTLSGRVELLLRVVRTAVPLVFAGLGVLFALAGAFAVRYRRALKHKLLQLPVRTDQRRRRAFYVQQHPQP